MDSITKMPITMKTKFSISWVLSKTTKSKMFKKVVSSTPMLSITKFIMITKPLSSLPRMKKKFSTNLNTKKITLIIILKLLSIIIFLLLKTKNNCKLTMLVNLNSINRFNIILNNNNLNLFPKVMKSMDIKSRFLNNINYLNIPK